MNPYRKRIPLLALALLLFLLPGCRPGTPAPSAPAMGRYVERALPLPTDFSLVLGVRQEPGGALLLLGFVPDSEGHYIYLRQYRSTDGGAAWTEESPAYLDFFNADESRCGAEAAAWGPDGVLYLAVSDADYNLFMGAVIDGEVRLSAWPIPSASDGSGLRSFRVAENGDFILDCFSEFLQVDAETGAVKNVYTASASDGSAINDGWALSGNTLALSEASRITYYNLDTGSESGFLTCSGPNEYSYSNSNFYRIMDFGADGALYFADPKGLYRAVPGTDALERLADGSLTSLSTPSMSRIQFCAMGDGRYLALCWSNEEWRLLSYAYDPETPTLPNTELTVWSLVEDPLIQQAITAFQNAESSVHVTYQVGIPSDGAVTREDAIRTLNTQLLAGKGPDLLVLDGLPLDSYVEKGILTDLSLRLDALDASGGLLRNITGSLRQPDGALYAIPAQFQVPMLHGSDDAMSAIHDLVSMADWLEANAGAYRMPFLFTKVENYLRFFYPPLASSLTDAEGGMDREKLSGFLSQIKRLADLRTDPDDSEGHHDYDLSFEFGPLGWTAGYSALDVGNLTRFQGLYTAWTASDLAGGGSTDTLFGADSFLPITVLGVSSQSAQQDLAWRFVQAVLSDEVQGQAVGSGIPVSAAAFAASTQQNSDGRPDGSFSTYGTTFYDAEGASVPVYLRVMYPPEEYRAGMSERLTGLKTPIIYDTAVLQILIDNTRGYWSGSATLDATVDAIMSKMKLYEAE